MHNITIYSITFSSKEISSSCFTYVVSGLILTCAKKQIQFYRHKRHYFNITTKVICLHLKFHNRSDLFKFPTWVNSAELLYKMKVGTPTNGISDGLERGLSRHPGGLLIEINLNVFPFNTCCHCVYVGRKSKYLLKTEEVTC